MYIWREFTGRYQQFFTDISKTISLKNDIFDFSNLKYPRNDISELKICFSNTIVQPTEKKNLKL